MNCYGYCNGLLLLYIWLISNIDVIRVESIHWKGLTEQESNGKQSYPSIYAPKYKVVLYENGMFEGNWLEMDLALNECIDLPYSFNDITSSVETNGHCVVLCENSQCSGECRRYYGPDTDNDGYYIDESFNDKASSIILCGVADEDDEIIVPQPLVAPEFTDNESIRTLSPGEKYQITLYEDGFYQGRQLIIQMGLSECVDIPISFNDRTSSIEMEGNCAVLCEHNKCTGKCGRYGISSDPWIGNELNDKYPEIHIDLIQLDISVLSELEPKSSTEDIVLVREQLNDKNRTNKENENSYEPNEVQVIKDKDVKGLSVASADNHSKSELFHENLPIQRENNQEIIAKGPKTVWKYFGIILALLSTLFIALSTYIVKILKVNYGYHVYISIFWRFVGIFIGSLPVFCYFKWYQKASNLIPSDGSKRRNSIIFLMGRCIFGTSGFVFQYMALSYIPLGDASVIAYSSPVLVLLMAWCFLNEKCGWFPSIIAGLTILGVVLIARPSFLFNTTRKEIENEGHKFKGILLALSAMVCAASTTICLRLARGIHFSVISICFGIIGMIIGIGLSLSLISSNEFKIPRGVTEIGLFVILGILSYLAQIGLTMALKYESPGPVSVIRSMNCVILFGLDGISGIVPHPLSICGAVIVILSVGLIGFRRWISFQPKTSKYVRFFGFILK